MNIFKNKTNTYKIYCDLDKTKQVIGLVEKYAAVNTVVETRAHRSLSKDNVRVTVTFKTKESEPVIYKLFLDAFKGYRIKINDTSIAIRKETGF